MKFNFRPLINRYHGALTFLIIIAAILRLFNLGYSDYQGDEIKALFLPGQGQSIWDFLLVQRKGPLQFVITWAVKLVNPSYDNQFLVRLPFALAGVISVYFFYKLVKEHFGNRISFYATLFFLTNGFLIAFSRIAQYQSLVIMFMLGALYFLTLASAKKEFETKGIILGFLFWALSLLSHYDGVFIAPFFAYLIYKWWISSGLKKRNKIRILGISGLLFSVILASFYLPFILSLTDKTLDYWEGRLTGEVSGKISSSMYLFSVYQPIYVVHFYKILAVLGVLLSVASFVTKKSRVKQFLEKMSIMTISNRKALLALIAWIVPAVVFMEKIVYIPGTHIYVYLIPLFIFLAFGIYLVENLMKEIVGKNIGRSVFIYGVIVLFTFIYAQSYAVFVDNSVEYPWREEKFFLWTFPRPNAIYHLSMFGFPYYRNWEGIRDYLKSSTLEPTIAAYSTNERKALARYYINLEKSSDKAGIYIYIKNPQSFTNEIVEEKPKYWVANHAPEYTLSRNGEEIVRVYLMVPGSLEEIQKMGY
jgi:4-amino-4-deoxy-L-arabinose transferase-like glycosyltransferase